MKSPFPGMDPYLERRWSDVHHKLITYVADEIQLTLPPDLRARAEERIILEESSGTPLTAYRSDIAVVEGTRIDTARSSESATELAEPVFVEYLTGPEIDSFIQIIDITSGDRVVTSIEVLSPGNKSPGRSNQDYLEKIDDYMRTGTNVVEVDLLRSSRGRLPVTELSLPLQRRTAYLACIWRALMPQRWETYSIPLRRKLPAIPIPLRQSDDDVRLDLQPLIERVYVNGRHYDIDYSKPPDPPLNADDAVWADQLLRSAGRR